jgi:hypothetical protein
MPTFGEILLKFGATGGAGEAAIPGWRSSSATTASPPAIYPGQQLGDHYTVGERIGGGGMADVFRARDLYLHRDVAIKVMKHGMASGETCARMLQEGRATAAIDHLVQVCAPSSMACGRPEPARNRARYGRNASDKRPASRPNWSMLYGLRPCLCCPLRDAKAPSCASCRAEKSSPSEAWIARAVCTGSLTKSASGSAREPGPIEQGVIAQRGGYSTALELGEILGLLGDEQAMIAENLEVRRLDTEADIGEGVGTPEDQRFIAQVAEDVPLKVGSKPGK